jgi:uncharacterized protein YqeY
MTIKEELAAELKDALRGGDKARLAVVRQVQSEVTLARSAPGFTGDPEGDDLYRAVIGSYVKKMEKAVEEYRGMGERGSNMADKLAYEVSYLSRWIPSKLSEADTERLVADAIAELGVAGDPKAAGRVIGHLMKSENRDDLDGGLVNRIVRKSLGA